MHLIDATLSNVFWGLRVQRFRRPAPRAPAAHCPCGRNPLVAFYAAGRQALHEALVGVQAATPGLTPAIRDEELEALDAVLDPLVRREIESLCAICQFQDSSFSAARGAQAGLAFRPDSCC